MSGNGRRQHTNAGHYDPKNNFAVPDEKILHGYIPLGLSAVSQDTSPGVIVEVQDAIADNTAGYNVSRITLDGKKNAPE